ncbi:GlsB/YeaQ/YmgE family stress response membrane protein [Pseudokineococcus basanitobsidens]|uniref:GlsB/YeaQ/YmgE family stress response membrane protein n=1 Tax=Pseudokineococcus basanitobsidens TaxID=1926649 RepID=A0ABU8RIL4_9ACTN
MTVSGIISAIIVGLVVGALARLVLPGKQDISILLTLLIGLVAAFIGGFIGNAINDEPGFSFLTLIIQVVLAVIGVAIVAGTSGRRSVRR